MKYPIIRNHKYDFIGESYSSSYPNLHRYPATMIPQIGINILKELGINKGIMLDPYCGSGSSFIVGLHTGLKRMDGYDINPLAILISKVKYTKIDITKLKVIIKNIKNNLFKYSFKPNEKEFFDSNNNIYNIDFWFPKNSIIDLHYIKDLINSFDNVNIRNFLFVPFSETLRECSYTKTNEFKLCRMSEELRKNFYPNTIDIYIQKLEKVFYIYEKFYYPILDGAVFNLTCNYLYFKDNYYDLVLTSPPYGDSRTTVAYGQFSTFANEWMGINYARQIDKMLMGGKTVKRIIKE